MPNTKDVRIGAPDQATTGAILHAPLGTVLPSISNLEPDQAFTGNEYVSEDGLTLAPNMSTGEIKDWSGATVRKVLETFDGTLSWTMISTNEGSMGVAFGAEHVTKAAATQTHGEILKTELGAHLPERQSWVFKMKDGDAKILIVVPDGQITETAEVTFAASAAVGWNVTLSTYPDADGQSIYIYTDDGVTTA